MIAAEPRFEVVAEARDGASGLEEANKSKPDVVILDVTLPRGNGLDVVRQLQMNRSPAKVIILTMHTEEDVFIKAVNLGVRGYVLKENTVGEILNCLKAVADGEYYLTPSMSACLLGRRRRTLELEAATPGVTHLTTAERRVLKRIADNRTSKEIGREFCISPRTVEAHRANICSKLRLHGNHCLLQFAIEHRAVL